MQNKLNSIILYIIILTVIETLSINLIKLDNIRFGSEYFE